MSGSYLGVPRRDRAFDMLVRRRCAETRRENAVERRRCYAEVLGREVPVAERDRERLVAEEVLDLLRRSPGLHHPARAGVSEIVPAEVRDARTAQRGFPGRPEAVPVAAAEDQPFAGRG